jgi:hypothetical protein
MAAAIIEANDWPIPIQWLMDLKVEKQADCF